MEWYFVVIIALAVGFVVYIFTKNNLKSQLLIQQERTKNLEHEFTTKQQDHLKLSEELTTKIEQIKTLSIEKSELQKELEFSKERYLQLQHDAEKKQADTLKEIEKLQEQFSSKFENLANKIFESKSEKFTQVNKENIQQILSPLRDRLFEFQKRIDETHKDTLQSQSSLKQEIINLKQLNEKITQEANNLTKALTSESKTRGNWGELVLERVLEKSGLEKGREYDVQASFKNEEGRTVYPDVVVHLPDEKKMIIDSKVSLVAYDKFINAEEESEQERHLKTHLASIKKHVDDLSAKNYHDLYQINSPDFTLLFIPIEYAFAIATKHDEQLYNYAFEKNIVIVTPTTLLATLRTIESMWKNEKQRKYALDIASEAGKLYDQFVGLTDELLTLGKQIKTVQTTYEGSMKKLSGRGNLITKIEKLKNLGAKANKTINAQLLERANENLE